MSGLSDGAVTRLKSLGSWPEFESPRYSVMEEIGRGGMGTIYLAFDEELGREVAIKVPNALAGPALERRLQLEAHVLARLEHPGIVPIHDTGRLADGRLFYVMKRIQGRTLGQHLEAVPGLTERLRVFERICEPVTFAHAQGIIHRDLKPENVMVGSFGEVMVLDWGVAKAVVGLNARNVNQEPAGSKPSRDGQQTSQQPSSSMTDQGTVVGTRGFMAPEQARAGVDEIDQRADVYSLGAILFLLLTNEVPGSDRDPVVQLRRHGVPRPLAAVCGRALAVDPAERYGTVAALADDVGRYRAGGPVDAYPETIVDRVVRFGRTYRTAILLVLAYIVMRAVVAFVAGW